MSNDKVQAALGEDLAARLAEYDAAKDALTPNQRAFAEAMGQVHVAASRTPEEVLAMADRARALFRQETTGEHIQHKLVDDLYQDFIDPKDVPEHHHVLPELSDAQADRLILAVSHRGPERGWFPTPVEIIMSLCIMAAIVGGFIWSVMIGLW